MREASRPRERPSWIDAGLRRYFATKVPRARQQAYLNQAGGNRGQAYRNWLNNYVDSRIDPRRFMTNPEGVTPPRLEQLER